MTQSLKPLVARVGTTLTAWLVALVALLVLVVGEPACAGEKSAPARAVAGQRATTQTSTSRPTRDRGETVPLDNLKKAFAKLNEGLGSDIRDARLLERIKEVEVELTAENPDLVRLEGSLRDLQEALGTIQGRWDENVTEPLHTAREELGKCIAKFREFALVGGPPQVTRQYAKLRTSHDRRLEKAALDYESETDPVRKQAIRRKYAVLLQIKRQIDAHVDASGRAGGLRTADVYAPIVAALMELDDGMDIARAQADLVRLELEGAREVLGAQADMCRGVRTATEIRDALGELFKGIDEAGLGAGLGEIQGGLSGFSGIVDRVSSVLAAKVPDLAADLTAPAVRNVNVDDPGIDVAIEKYAARGRDRAAGRSTTDAVGR